MNALFFSVIVLAPTGSVIGFASGLPGIWDDFLMMPVQFCSSQNSVLT